MVPNPRLCGPSEGLHRSAASWEKARGRMTLFGMTEAPVGSHLTEAPVLRGRGQVVAWPESACIKRREAASSDTFVSEKI